MKKVLFFIIGLACSATINAHAGVLMDVMPDQIGAELKKANVSIYGYTEAGFMYDATVPQNKKGPTFMGLNNLKNTPVVDKVSLNIERLVDASKKQFDLGFHVEGIWGADAKLIHSNGLFDTQTGRYQGDLLQAYVDVGLPSLPLKIRIGKWIELAGFEHFSANIYGAFGDPSRALYSYSYQFLYAEPGTQTGVLAMCVVNPQLSVDAGFTRGWNQSTRDANNSVDILGRITYSPTDKTSIVFVTTVGPEFPIGFGKDLPDADDAHWWTALDLVVTHKFNDKLSVGSGLDFVNAPAIPGLSDGSKQWGGLAGYVSYAINPYCTLNGRLEWYNDSSRGFSTGAAMSADYYESTLGFALKPFPNSKYLSQLLFRPEVRFDWANRPVFATNDKHQLMLGADILYTF